MDKLNERVLNVAKIYLSRHTTVRDVAKVVGYSKSTVHNYLTKRLPIVNYDLYLKLKELLEYNKKIRHIRGGLATKLHYKLELR